MKAEMFWWKWVTHPAPHLRKMSPEAFPLSPPAQKHAVWKSLNWGSLSPLPMLMSAAEPWKVPWAQRWYTVGQEKSWRKIRWLALAYLQVVGNVTVTGWPSSDFRHQRSDSWCSWRRKAAPINGAFFCLAIRQMISVWGSVLPQTGWASPLILNIHF